MFLLYNLFMKLTSQNKKLTVLKLYYEGMSATAICKDYRIPHSTLYKWIADYPLQSVMDANARMNLIKIPKMLSHSKKLENEIDFLRRTVVKEIPLRERMAIIDREYGKESLSMCSVKLSIQVKNSMWMA